MTTKSRVSLLALALCVGLLLNACQDTKTRQENEQLKAQVSDLQKELGSMGNRVDEATKARDDLMKQNVALQEENNRLKGKHGGARPTKSRRRRRRSAA
jgi:peptidoglycan hydrolase CwlO-like protein